MSPTPTPSPTTRVWRLGEASILVHPRAVLVVSAGLVMLVALALLGLQTGSTQLGLTQVLRALGGGEKAAIVQQMRLPRVLCAIVVGACLAVAGSVFQTLSRNALGSPDIIGVTSGAALGAVASIVILGAGRLGAAAGALAGCLLVAWLIHLLSGRAGGGQGQLVLIGIGVGAFCQALTAMMLTHTDPDLAIGGQKWLTGTLNARSWPDIAPALFAAVVLLPVLVGCARHLNALEVGDDLAHQFGVDLRRTRAWSSGAAVGLCALSVASIGPVAFVALAAPHLARRLCGNAVVPIVAAAVLGSVLLLGADIVGQRMPGGMTMPVGIATGAFGGLYMTLVLTRRRQ